jgi:hypothetical protein
MKPYLKKTHHKQKNRAGGVAQDEGPELKPQYCRKRERERGKKEREEKRNTRKNT